MLNLFKKKSINKVADTIKQVFTDESVIIAKIHDDFDSASERLLSEAKSIIDNAKEDVIAKGERLKSLGFNSSKDAVRSNKEVERQKENKELAEHIMYYNQHYPFHKFITEKEVKKICEKYSLVFGNAEDYKGEIPEKNIQEIERFVLRNEDMKNCELNYHKVERTTHGNYYIPTLEKTDLYGYFEMSKYGFGYYFNSYPTDEKVIYTKQPFKMCAPAKDFDMTDKKVDGYRIVPKDPIVLQPVKGGYLIVTKWGLEASDELVLNTIDN